MEDLKYILVRTDCTYSVVDIPEDDFLEQAYKLIGCDLIETLPIMGNEIFILDEEGKNNERDLNLFCTALHRKLYGRDFLVGNILIGCYKDYDIRGLTPDVINKYVAALERCEYENICA